MVTDGSENGVVEVDAKTVTQYHECAVNHNLTIEWIARELM